MKTRLGFVSNSSSSSFCIYGISGYYPPDKSEVFEESDEDDDVIYSKADDAGLNAYHPEGYDGWFIGKSLSSCEDSQTMAEFKAEVRALVKKTFGDNIKDTEFEIISEAYYS